MNVTHIRITFTACAGEKRLVKYLPQKMKSDLAIHVHLNTILNVSLFKVRI
jgi:hypothetical protein